jgi:hypothetical protein
MLEGKVLEERMILLMMLQDSVLAKCAIIMVKKAPHLYERREPKSWIDASLSTSCSKIETDASCIDVCFTSTSEICGARYWTPSSHDSQP